MESVLRGFGFKCWVVEGRFNRNEGKDAEKVAVAWGPKIHASVIVEWDEVDVAASRGGEKGKYLVDVGFASGPCYPLVSHLFHF